MMYKVTVPLYGTRTYYVNADSVDDAMQGIEEGHGDYESSDDDIETEPRSWAGWRAEADE